MPRWYRLNTLGSWSPLKVYRLNTGGAWQPLRQIYRLYTDGQWRLVHTGQETVVATTAPTLTSTDPTSNTANFYGNDTITLTRGAYTNTTADSNTSYRMTIYSSSSSAGSLSNWTVASRTTFTGANSSASTTITYALTDDDAKNGLYFAGEIRVNNDANTAGSTPQDFETPLRVLSRISFSTTSFSVNKSSTGATFAWTVTGVPDATYLYQDAANSASVVRITRADNQAFVYDAAAGTGSLNGTATVPAGTLVPQVGYRADLIIRANDGWKTDNNFTKNNKGASLLNQTYLTFVTPATEPVNTVAPTISPLNNRSRVPVNTQLTATTGTWTNVQAGATYEYQWTYDDGTTPTTTAWSTSNTLASIPTSYATSGSVTVKVRVSNPDGGIGTTTSPNSYLLDPLPTISAPTPITAEINAATNFSYTISGYPTSYSIDWTNDGTIDFNQPTITANTASVNVTRSNTYTSGGTPTLRLRAQPGNIVLDTTITITPSAFTYSLYNQNTDLAARSSLSQQRVTSTNLVLFEYGSSMPANVESDTLFIQGTGSSAFNLNQRTVTAVTANGTKAYYTCSTAHGYLPGGKVTVTGLTGTPNFNITEATLDPLTSGSIFVIATTLNGSISAQNGTSKASANTTQTSVNRYDNSGNLNSPTGPWEWVTAIDSTASTSPISFFVRTQGNTRYIYVNTNTTAGAQSWKILGAAWDFAGASTVTYFNNGLGTLASTTSGTQDLNANTMPYKIFEVTGAANPTITINGITAYSGTTQGGTTKVGSTGSLQLLGVVKAVVDSALSSANYTYLQPPNAFTYTLSNASTVTTPTVSQTRQSASSNNVLIEIASTKPADTVDYSLTVSGTGTSSPVTNQSIVNLNQFTNSADWSTTIATSASNSPITTSVVANGSTRTYNANVSTTTNASSWAITFSWSNATASSVTYYSNGTGTADAATSNTRTVYTNSMPVKIAEITGATNPTVTITSVTAYTAVSQGGLTTNGTAGTTTSLAISRPTSTAASQTLNWTYANQNLTTNPAYGTATRTNGGFTASISTSPNPTGGTYSVVSQTAGSASVNSSSGALTVTSLTAGQSSTVTVRYSLTGYNPVDITSTGQALSNFTTNPAYGASTAALGGWSASISTSPNPTGGTYAYVSTTAGSATVSSTTGAVTASSLTASQSSTVTVSYSLSGYNPVNITASGTALSAPSGGSVGVPTLTSGTDGRIGAVYSVNIVTDASNYTSRTFQWQYYNVATATWNTLLDASSIAYTGSTYTFKYNEGASGTLNMTGRYVRCVVTWSNAAGSQTSPTTTGQTENSVRVLLPTITGVTATLSTTSPFIVYRCYGYNFQSIQSKNSYSSDNITFTTDANYTYSQSTNATIPITRQSGNGGDLFYYKLEVAPYDKIGTGSAPTTPYSLGSTINTTVIRNNATNRTNSPVNVYGTGSA